MIVQVGQSLVATSGTPMSALHELDLWLCGEVHFNIHRLLVEEDERPKLEETSTPALEASHPEQPEPQLHRRKWPKRPSAAMNQLDVRLRDFLRGRFRARPSAPSALPFLFNDTELGDLQEAFTNGLTNWKYKVSSRLPRYLTLATGEVTRRLPREEAERWSSLSARFLAQLKTKHLSLADGIRIVREWLWELRLFLEAMGEDGLLPVPDGRFPTPTNPSPPPEPPKKKDQTAVGRMRRAIAEHPAGRKAKPSVLIKKAKIGNQRGRAALGQLQKNGEYEGFARSTAKRSPKQESG
jgi:hypothetical protein